MQQANDINQQMMAQLSKLTQIIDANKSTPDHNEAGSDTTEVGSESPADGATPVDKDKDSDSGDESETTDEDDELLTNSSMRKQIAHSFSDYQKQLDTCALDSGV